MKTLHRIGPVLFAACLCITSLPAIAESEGSDDKILMNCQIRPRDAVAQKDGTYKVAYVSHNLHTATNRHNDLRLYDNNAGKPARRQFSLTWMRYDSSNGNQWMITPDFKALCMSTADGYVHATSCADYKIKYLTMDEGYFVISGNADASNAWLVPSNPNGTGFVERTKFNPKASLSVRRRFHWRIDNCRDMFGNNASPAP